MNAMASSQEVKTTTTTLFDLMNALQQNAATPLDEALIVPIIVDLLRSGRIRCSASLSICDGISRAPARSAQTASPIR